MLPIHQGTNQIVSYRNNELMASSPFENINPNQDYILQMLKKRK